MILDQSQEDAYFERFDKVETSKCDAAIARLCTCPVDDNSVEHDCGGPIQLPTSILDRYRFELDADQEPLLQRLFESVPTNLDYENFRRAFDRAGVRLVLKK